MTTTPLQSLQIHPDAGDPAIAQQQVRFNALVQEISAARTALEDWTDRLDRADRTLNPLRRELQAAWRQWVIELDHVSLQPGLSRLERAQVEEIVRDAAASLLPIEPDSEIEAIAARYTSVESSSPKEAHNESPEPIEADNEDAFEDWERRADAAAAQREDRAAKRRAESAMKRRKQETQDVSQSLRDVYRRLASVLHPDREPDEKQRERKTGLMQLANQAYEANNLLALLELQLQAEELDAAHLARANAKRLQNYVTLLEDQLKDLQNETRRIEREFRSLVGLTQGAGLQARKADRMVSAEGQRLKDDGANLRHHTKLLRDLDATKEWLREERRS